MWATAAGQGSGSGRATNPFNRCSTNLMQWLNGFAIPIAIEWICGAVTSGFRATLLSIHRTSKRPRTQNKARIPGCRARECSRKKKNANQARFVRSRKKFYGKHGWGIHTPLPRSFKSCRKLRRSEQQMSKKNQ